jgi:hypothetical protein
MVVRKEALVHVGTYNPSTRSFDLMNEQAFRAWTCSHNHMVETGDPNFAWKCADCGYVYQ